MLSYQLTIIRSQMKKIILLALLFFSTLSLHADVEDKWKINAGAMFVTNFETEMQLTPKNLPVGARVNSKEQLGMKNDTGVFRLDTTYRFNDTHGLDFTYFTVRSDGQKVIQRDIQWDDRNISAGATLSSHFNMDTYKLNYVYSFYHNDDVELALSVGLHITGLNVGLGASGYVDGNASQAYSSSSALRLPLPVVGFKGEYTIIKKRLFINYKSDYFTLNYEGFKGSLISTSLALEYRFVDHVGVGLGYNSNKIYLKADDGDNKLEVTNDLSGALLYFTYIY